MKKIELCKLVYKDALNHSDIPASVGVFLSEWSPWMFRKLKRQEKEIECLKYMLDSGRVATVKNK